MSRFDREPNQKGATIAPLIGIVVVIATFYFSTPKAPEATRPLIPPAPRPDAASPAIPALRPTAAASVALTVIDICKAGPEGVNIRKDKSTLSQKVDEIGPNVEFRVYGVEPGENGNWVTVAGGKIFGRTSLSVITGKECGSN